jgi:serine/threonine protein kinase
MLGTFTSHISFRESRYVAIKVSVARASETNNELGIFEHLARHRDQRGARSVMELLHSFEHEGPNGRHLCLVFPVMGPSASTMERIFRTNPMRSGRYPLWIGKSMLKQLLLGLSFLHRNGVTHTGAYLLLTIYLEGAAIRIYLLSFAARKH